MDKKSIDSYFPLLDYLRILAIFAVILYHSPYITSDSILVHFSRFGSLGVDLFFVLSGFLIGNQLFLKIKKKQDFSLLDFYIRRAFRIWPNYFALVILFCFFGYVLGWSEFRISPLYQYLLLIQNYFSVEHFPASWSLCIEEHFYLFFPLILFFILKIKHTKTVSVLIILFIIVLGVILRASYWQEYRPDLHFDKVSFYKYFYFRTHMRLDGLVIGVAVAALRNFSDIWVRFRYFRIIIFTTALLSLFFTIVILSKISGGTQSLGSYMLFNLLIAISFGLMVASAVDQGKPPREHFTSFVPFLSNLSYSMYLTHIESFRILKYFGVTEKNMINNVLAILLIILVASVLFFLVEKPFLRLRSRFTNAL